MIKISSVGKGKVEIAEKWNKQGQVSGGPPPRKPNARL